MRLFRAVVLLLPLLTGIACSDPNAPRIPSPHEDRRSPTRDPVRGLDGGQSLAVVESTTAV